MGFDKCEMTRVHLYGVIRDSLTALEVPCTARIPSSRPTPKCLATTDLFTDPTALPFPERRQLGAIQRGAFPDCSLSLRDMHLRFLHVFLWLDRSRLFTADYCSLVWLYHGLPTHLCKDVSVASNVGPL